MKSQNTVGQKSKRHRNFSFCGQETQKHGWPDLPSFYGLSADGAIDTVKHKIRGGPWLQGWLFVILVSIFRRKIVPVSKCSWRWKRHKIWLWMRTFYVIRWVCLMRHSGTREFNWKWWSRFTLKVSECCLQHEASKANPVKFPWMSLILNTQPCRHDITTATATKGWWQAEVQ